MEKLLEILDELHPDVDFETEEHLIDNKILDSFDIVTIVAEIDAEYERMANAYNVPLETVKSSIDSSAIAEAVLGILNYAEHLFVGRECRLFICICGNVNHMLREFLHHRCEL